MKAKLLLALLVSSFVIRHSSLVFAATTINATNKFAYGANLGWMDWRGDTNNGAVIGEFVCSGYLWAANVGWINLGDGAPTNGIYYQDLSANDFGVNQDGVGNLRGYAWGANIGWINFESTGAPQVDLKIGKLNGFVYSANCGWISLSNAFAVVQTDTLQPGALAPNGLPTAWLLQNFGTTNVSANADADLDGISNAQEYQAGTNPNDASDRLVITAFGANSTGSVATVTWRSVLSRCYYVEKSLTIAPTSWMDSGLGLIPPDGASTTRVITDALAPIRFYRVQVAKPLSP